jgi:hypothetical protein
MGKRKVSGAKVFVFFFITLILPALIGGGVMTFFGVREIYLARQSRSWASTDATITRSEIVVKTGGDARGVSSGPTQGTYYDTDILYQFTVDGQTRQGNKVAFGFRGSTYSNLQTLLSRYPTGKTVTVYYRASDPAYCILEPGLEHGQLWVLPTIGVFLSLFMIILTIFLPKMINKQKKPSRRG